ncbi:MAG: DUF4199 domain-containing protein [Prevotella sp.]
MTPSEYTQMTYAARLNGAVMGLVWVSSFLCFAYARLHPLLSIAFNVSIIMIPFVANVMLRRYCQATPAGAVSFKRAYAFLMMMFFHAILIFALGQWAYFQFLDNGTLLGGMMDMVSSPEYAAVLKAYNMSKSDVEQQLQALMETRPIDFALSFMWMNIFVTSILSVFIALIGRIRRR